MIKTDLLEKRVIARLEKTQLLFGYISLEAIVNSYFKHHRNNNSLMLKKVYSINKIPISKAPPTKQFREMLQQQITLRMANKNNSTYIIKK
jgi:hypothetical protein